MAADPSDTNSTVGSGEQDDRLSELTDEQLYLLVNDIREKNEVLSTETEMFQKFYRKYEKDILSQSAQPAVVLMAAQTGLDITRTSGTRKRSKIRSGTSDRTLRLTTEQKCEIAQKEIDSLTNDIQKSNDLHGKEMESCEAIMEEGEMRLADLKKESYEFGRDIVKGALNSQNNKIIAEKILRYFEEFFKSKDSVIEKLRLNNCNLKVQRKKLILQIRQKEEIGEVLHAVDFNQLKIENQQYLEKIDERNQDLIRLKLMAGNTMLIMNSYKAKLHKMTMESERLQSEIVNRNELLSKLYLETVKAKEEKSKADDRNKKLREYMSDYSVPHLMGYVTERANFNEISKNVKIWDRKVDIATLAFNTYQRKWQSIQFAHRVPNKNMLSF